MLTTPSIGFLMHDAARLMRNRFDVRARAHGATRQQWRVLLNLAREGEGRTQAELADALDVERITLCRMIDRLADADLVERRADPADRRVWRIHLRPKAHGLIEELAAIGAEVERNALELLEPAAREAFLHSLTIVRDGLRARPDERNAA